MAQQEIARAVQVSDWPVNAFESRESARSSIIMVIYNHGRGEV